MRVSVLPLLPWRPPGDHGRGSWWTARTPPFPANSLWRGWRPGLYYCAPLPSPCLHDLLVFVRDLWLPRPHRRLFNTQLNINTYIFWLKQVLNLSVSTFLRVICHHSDSFTSKLEHVYTCLSQPSQSDITSLCHFTYIYIWNMSKHVCFKPS